ncbi:MAG: hypothetical protein WB709_07880, partial [Solirubrobacteraceae bacterium]
GAGASGSTGGGTASSHRVPDGGVRSRGKGPGRSTGSGGADASASHLQAFAAVSTSAPPPWFSGGDLLGLVLASGLLALIAVMTSRIAGTHHD